MRWILVSGTSACCCTVSGMFPSGCLCQQEHYSFERMSLTGRETQKTTTAEEQSFHNKEPQALLPEDFHPHRLSEVDSLDVPESWSQGGSRATCNPEGIDKVVENSLSKHNNLVLNGDGEGKEEKGSAREGSGNLVGHLFKELKGINKIQEEISDLRQYLTSVRGSVDEASCCVDAVLSEIEELYCGAAVAPLPDTTPQAEHSRRGSLGRQNSVTSPCAGCLPCSLSPKHRHVYQVILPLSERANQNDQEPKLWPKERESRGTALQNPLCFSQSTSSLSSCLSPAASCLFEADAWPLFDGSWSEKDVDSEDLHIHPKLRNSWVTGQVEGCMPALMKSSERLDWSLFMPYDTTPFGFSGQMDYGPPRGPREEAAFSFCHSADIVPSGSSADHTLHVGLDQCSEDLNGSEVLLSDYAEPVGDCSSSWRNALLDSAHSLDMDWIEPSSSSREDVQDPLLTETDPIEADFLPDADFDMTTLSKAVLTFRLALKGPLKKIEATEPGDAQDFRSTTMALIPLQGSTKDLNEEETGDCVSTIKEFALEPSDLPAASCSPVRTPEHKAQCSSGTQPCSVEHGVDDVRLSTISENQAPEKLSPVRPSDARHRERITNFQQILREKRQIRQRLSRSTLDSQGSQSSQWSQSSQSSQCQDEFIAGIEQNVFETYLLVQLMHKSNSQELLMSLVCLSNI